MFSVFLTIKRGIMWCFAVVWFCVILLCLTEKGFLNDCSYFSVDSWPPRKGLDKRFLGMFLIGCVCQILRMFHRFCCSILEMSDDLPFFSRDAENGLQVPRMVLWWELMQSCFMLVSCVDLSLPENFATDKTLTISKDRSLKLLKRKAATWRPSIRQRDPKALSNVNQIIQEKFKDIHISTDTAAPSKRFTLKKS